MKDEMNAQDREKFTEMQSDLNSIKSTVGNIHTLLVGNPLDSINGGMINQFHDNARRLSVLEEKGKSIKWVGAGAAAVASAFLWLIKQVFL